MRKRLFRKRLVRVKMLAKMRVRVKKVVRRPGLARLMGRRRNVRKWRQMEKGQETMMWPTS